VLQVIARKAHAQVRADCALPKPHSRVKSRLPNGHAAQPAAPLHLPKPGCMRVRAAQGASAPGQRTRRGRLQRLVGQRPAIQAETLRSRGACGGHALNCRRVCEFHTCDGRRLARDFRENGTCVCAVSLHLAERVGRLRRPLIGAIASTNLRWRRVLNPPSVQRPSR